MKNSYQESLRVACYETVILIITAFDEAPYPPLVADPRLGESPELALPDATVEVDVEQALN